MHRIDFVFQKVTGDEYDAAINDAVYSASPSSLTRPDASTLSSACNSSPDTKTAQSSKAGRRSRISLGEKHFASIPSALNLAERISAMNVDVRDSKCSFAAPEPSSRIQIAFKISSISENAAFIR